jgi:uncharacterized membrane protein
MRIEMLHPMMVHFAIALLISAVAVGLLGWLRNSRPVRRTAMWMMWFGAGFGVLAVLTGLVAEENIPHGEALHELIETHELLAFITLGVFGATAFGWLLFALLPRLKLEPWLHLAGVIGVGLIVATAWVGGDMVYDHGAAVKVDDVYVQEVDVKNAPRRTESDQPDPQPLPQPTPSTQPDE